MRSAALTLMALSALSACAESTDPGAVAFNAPAYSAPANAGTPFFTTSPAYFVNPPDYLNDPGYITLAPVYIGQAYFIAPIRAARHSYCPPRIRAFRHR